MLRPPGAVRGTTIFQLNLRPNWALGHQFGSDAMSGDESTEYQRLACNSPRGLLPRRLWRFGAPMLNYHPWFRRREPCLSINYTCKRITNWQNQTISLKSGRETLKRRPRRKKRGSASSSPQIRLRLRWKQSKSPRFSFSSDLSSRKARSSLRTIADCSS